MQIDSVMTPRLYAIADCIPRGSVVADVGTDHGYIPIYACLKLESPRGLAMDLKQGPLDRAGENIRRFNLGHRIETRLSDGLEALGEGEADVAVIAGMGGLLISEILERSPVRLSGYILQPMTATKELRQYLADKGYSIDHEVLAQEDDKFYTVLKVSHGHMQLENRLDVYVGRKLIENRDPLLLGYVESLLKKHGRIYEGLLRSGQEDIEDKKNEAAALVLELSQLKEACQSW